MRQIPIGSIVATAKGPRSDVPVRMPDGTLRHLTGTLSGTIVSPPLTKLRGRLELMGPDGKVVFSAFERVVICPGKMQTMATRLPDTFEDESIPAGTVVELLPTAPLASAV